VGGVLPSAAWAGAGHGQLYLGFYTPPAQVERQIALQCDVQVAWTKTWALMARRSEGAWALQGERGGLNVSWGECKSPASPHSPESRVSSASYMASKAAAGSGTMKPKAA